jgi:hypothetical protein
MDYFISFSKSELEALRLLDFFGSVKSVRVALNSSKSQAYRILKKLKEKELISNDFLVSTPYLKNLVLLLRKNPNLVGLLRDSNLAILLQMLPLKKLVRLLIVTSKQYTN